MQLAQLSGIPGQRFVWCLAKRHHTCKKDLHNCVGNDIPHGQHTHSPQRVGHVLRIKAPRHRLRPLLQPPHHPRPRLPPRGEQSPVGPNEPENGRKARPPKAKGGERDTPRVSAPPVSAVQRTTGPSGEQGYGARCLCWARAPSGSATRQRVVPTTRHSFVVCQ